MHQKITQAINCNSNTGIEQSINLAHHPEHDEQPRRDGKNQEKDIVSLEKTGLGLMVVSVKSPPNAVHDEFMSKPCHKLHTAKG